MTASSAARPHRVVVVGGGMVGTRFLDELIRASSATSSPITVTMLGEEPHAPYNRVLLSDAVAGRAHLTALGMPTVTSEQVTVHRGRPAARIFRAAGAVADLDGRAYPFDTLVLATGAAARLPELSDLPGPDVRPLRTVDDARALLAALPRVERVTVLGGGVLGVELACGLRARGAQVTLVHHRERLMERDLDAPGAQVLAAALADLGVSVIRDARVVGLRRSRGRLAGVRFADGRELASELLVPAIGTVPRVELARAAGLPVRSGIVVGADLRSPADPRIAAIGDCAEPPEGCTGLVAPGWVQAARLAQQISAAAGDTPPAEPAAGAPSAARVVRLKAVGVEAVSLGAAQPPAGGRQLTLLDLTGRRSVSVTVAEDRVVSAVCVGSPRTAAALTVAFERASPVPRDPAWLLVDVGAMDLAPQASSPTMMPSQATVCSCNGVTKAQIVAAHGQGDRDVTQVAARTRATTGCGGCRNTVEGLLEWLDRSEGQPPAPAGPSAGPLASSPAHQAPCETDVARV